MVKSTDDATATQRALPATAAGRTSSIPQERCLLVFAAVLAVGSAFFPLQVRNLPVSAREQSLPTEGSKKDDIIRFTAVSAGRLPKKGAREVSFTSFKSEDGVLVIRDVESYSSPSRSREEWDRMLKRAEKVLDRSPKQAPDGRTIGIRAVVQAGRSGRPDEKFAVFWTDGPDIYVLSSSSLRHVLAFEKQFYPPRGS